MRTLTRSTPIQTSRKPVEAQVAKLRAMAIEELRERIAASRALSVEDVKKKQASDRRKRAEEAAKNVRIA